jgi:hypothetical protein
VSDADAFRDTEPPSAASFLTQEMTLEERLTHVCVRLELASRRLQIGDHMIALLEHDNSMCLHAIRGLAKKLEAQEVEGELADYIQDRRKLLDELRGALRKLDEAGTIRPPAPMTDG